MSPPRIHVAAELVAGGELVLPSGAARHVALVLRMRRGDVLTLFDGAGHEAKARLLDVDRKHVVVQVESVFAGQGESPLGVHLGQAISKGDRMDYAIQKAVELGVAAITPLYTDHGDVRLKAERQAKKLAHWQAVAASACEQCGRATLPPVHSPMSLDAWLTDRDEPLRLMLHPAAGNHGFDGEVPASSALLIGPEGGLSSAEVDAARGADFSVLSLGPRILRTETAPVVALTLLQYWYGDLA
ncbi:16S rRNA (uracil(1498)-N(3))-methyltransferase [Aidingimonas lacisalsi]|uniref:16S rRNA (uracil(1498)-N(3))-methyltransferase n=1 Tax=Aidingimonas lacisalsi TaxID=2604086 RepID=UPI0011D1EAA3|nr:16S rRNA (uracil(1498)-N(3))-methyltransferase [Aidingimonas lacisalsi]